MTAEEGFTLDVIRYNDSGQGGGLAPSSGQAGLSGSSEAFLVQLLKLVLCLVMLEEVINRRSWEEGRPRTAPGLQGSVMRYHSDLPLAEQV